jgi:hypothetical protein
MGIRFHGNDQNGYFLGVTQSERYERASDGFIGRRRARGELHPTEVLLRGTFTLTKTRRKQAPCI